MQPKPIAQIGYYQFCGLSPWAFKTLEAKLREQEEIIAARLRPRKIDYKPHTVDLSVKPK